MPISSAEEPRRDIIFCAFTVVSALDKLSAQPQANWQRLDATIAEGNSESARLLRGLIDEVRRLRTEVRQAGTLRPARVA